MQQQNDRPARADRLAVERDPVRLFVDLLLRGRSGNVVDAHPPGADDGPQLAARGHTGLR